ncbi:hypothetical protein BC629DRAFT_1292030, partial [Irpex lacteus]
VDFSAMIYLLVLFLFDSIITISQEVDVIWRRKWTATTWLYVLTRHGTVIDQVIVLIPSWNLVLRCSCAAGEYIDGAFRLLQYLCLAWFSALRVYALLNGNYLLAGIVLLLNLVPFATNMSNDYCTHTQTFVVSLITRISVIIGDALVLVVTWTKTTQAYREARQLNIRAPLATVLFRDGTTNGPSSPLTLHLLMRNFTGTIYFLYVFLLSRQV